MARVYISTNDPVIFYLYDEQESEQTFGKDMIEDYGVEVPPELLERFKAVYSEYWKIQEEIGKYKK